MTLMASRPGKGHLIGALLLFCLSTNTYADYFYFSASLISTSSVLTCNLWKVAAGKYAVSNTEGNIRCNYQNSPGGGWNHTNMGHNTVAEGDPYGTCAWASPVTNQCYATAPTCTVGAVENFEGTGGEAAVPDYLNGDDNCYYERGAENGTSMYYGPGLDNWTAAFTATGDTAQVGASDGTDAADANGLACATSSSGNTLCLGSSGFTHPNCMTLNGEVICGRTVGPMEAKKMPYDGTCVPLVTGAVCEQSAINTPTDESDNPLPADTEFDIEAPTPDGGTSGYTYHPNGQGLTDTQTAADALGALGGTTGGTGCQPGEADCKALIDETGTPTAANDQYDDISGIGLDSFEAGIAGGEDFGSGTSIDVSTLLPGSGACQTMSINMGDAGMVSFPGTEGCSYMETFKVLFAWALYIITAITLFNIATGNREVA